MTELTVSIKDNNNGEEVQRTIEKLSWDQLWDALILYDKNKYHREKRKFYIISSQKQGGISN